MTLLGRFQLPTHIEAARERLGIFQIGDIESLGEPPTDGRQEIARLGPPTRLAPQLLIGVICQAINLITTSVFLEVPSIAQVESRGP